MRSPHPHISFRPGARLRPRMAIAVAMLAAALIAPRAAWGQDWYAGEFEKVLIGGSSARFPVHAGSPGCGEFTGGESDGYWYGVGAGFSDVIWDQFDLIARAGILQHHDRFTGDIAEPLWLYDATREAEARYDREYRYEARFRMLTIELLGSWRIAGGLSVALGGRFGYPLSSTLTQTDNIINAGDVAFDDGSTSRAMAGGEPITAAERTLDLRGAMAYTADLSGRIGMMAEISGSWAVLSRSPEIGWKDWDGSLGIGILYRLHPPRTEPAPPTAIADPPAASSIELPRDTIFPIANDSLPRLAEAPAEMPRETAPPARADSAGLTASIALYGIDERGEKQRGATADMIETIHRRTVRLGWEIPFDRDTILLPTSTRLASSGESSSFVADSLFIADSLHNRDARELEQRALDIVGERMRHIPSSTIGIEPGSRGAIAAARAGAIRRYLRDAWGIDPARVGVTEQPSRAGGSARITSSDTALTAPLRFERTDRTFAAPALKLEPLYSSDTGMKEWSIVVDHRGTVIARYTSSNPAAGNETSYDWHPNYEEIASDSAFLAASFTLEDLAGKRITAGARIPLALREHRRVVHHLEGPGDEERILYLFPAADSSSADLRDPSGETIGTIVRELPPRWSVEVIAVTRERRAGAFATRLARTIETALSKRAGGRVRVRVSTGSATTVGLAAEAIPSEGSVIVLVRKKR